MKGSETLLWGTGKGSVGWWECVVDVSCKIKNGTLCG